MSRALLHAVLYIWSTGGGIIIGMIVIRPIAEYLGSPQYANFQWRDIMKLKVRDDWRIPMADVISMIVFIAISLSVVLAQCVLWHIWCDCDDCNSDLWALDRLVRTVYQYVSFPIRYVFDIPIILYGGSKHWGVGGWNLRRSGRPTSIGYDGAQFWHTLRGVLHRDNDLPAAIYQDQQVWYRNGMIHRDHDPAVVTDRIKEYYSNDLIHNGDDQPARVTPNALAWYIHGINCRTDTELPAIIHLNRSDSELWSNDLTYIYKDRGGHWYIPRVIKL